MTFVVSAGKLTVQASLNAGKVFACNSSNFAALSPTDCSAEHSFDGNTF